MSRPRRGLTLIELVIILVIIAILVAIVLPRLRPRTTAPATSHTDTPGAPAVRADTGSPAPH